MLSCVLLAPRTSEMPAAVAAVAGDADDSHDSSSSSVSSSSSRPRSSRFSHSLLILVDELYTRL